MHFASVLKHTVVICSYCFCYSAVACNGFTATSRLVTSSHRAALQLVVWCDVVRRRIRACNCSQRLIFVLLWQDCDRPLYRECLCLFASGVARHATFVLVGARSVERPRCVARVAAQMTRLNGFFYCHRSVFEHLIWQRGAESEKECDDARALTVRLQKCARACVAWQRCVWCSTLRTDLRLLWIVTAQVCRPATLGVCGTLGGWSTHVRCALARSQGLLRAWTETH